MYLQVSLIRLDLSANTFAILFAKLHIILYEWPRLIQWLVVFPLIYVISGRKAIELSFEPMVYGIYVVCNIFLWRMQTQWLPNGILINSQIFVREALPLVFPALLDFSGVCERIINDFGNITNCRSKNFKQPPELFGGWENLFIFHDRIFSIFPLYPQYVHAPIVSAHRETPNGT